MEEPNIHAINKTSEGYIFNEKKGHIKFTTEQRHTVLNCFNNNCNICKCNINEDDTFEIDHIRSLANRGANKASAIMQSFSFSFTLSSAFGSVFMISSIPLTVTKTEGDPPPRGCRRYVYIFPSRGPSCIAMRRSPIKHRPLCKPCLQQEGAIFLAGIGNARGAYARCGGWLGMGMHG